MSMTDRLEAKLDALPDAPGCYLMRDRRGRIVYVGKAISLRKRVQSYFRQATLRSGGPKLRGLVNSIDDIEWMVTRSEADAILLEGKLIKDYRPRYNVSFKDDKRFLVIRIERGVPFPRLRLCRICRQDNHEYVGPFASSAAARAILDYAEKAYGIRKCAPLCPDAETYRHCINDVVRFCSAPCIGRTSAADYTNRVDEAAAFLAGRRPERIHDIRAAMLQAAQQQDFEAAAALRDTLHALRCGARGHGRMPASRAVRHRDAALPLAALGQTLGLDNPPALIACFDVSNISGTFAVASIVYFVDGLPAGNRYRHMRIRHVHAPDDAAMLSEAVSRHVTRLQEHAQPLPDLLVVDGGITQLRAAQAALERLQAAHVPAIGLAKRFETIIRDGPPAIQLERDHAALQLLQRLRDEAHRFALTYHQQVRNRRLRDSVLDEVPGIGPARKAALIRRFGSVARMAGAGVETLATVPGISPALAQAVHAALQRG